MKMINVDIMPNGDVNVSGHGVLSNNEEQKVVVTDNRTLVDSAQYQIGWHDGYRAHFNDENSKAHDAIDERMRKNAT
jgi:ribosomal protein S4E